MKWHERVSSTAGERLTQKFVERFWSYVDKTESCWNWTGSCTHGYGYFNIGGDRFRAHRLSLELAGRLPKHSIVLHKCDNRRCVNPDHLISGTQKENLADMVAKGRVARGTRRKSAKLTDDVVNEIRAAVGIQREIGERYGISQSQVSEIKAGNAWKHVPGLVEVPS